MQQQSQVINEPAEAQTIVEDSGDSGHTEQVLDKPPERYIYRPKKSRLTQLRKTLKVSEYKQTLKSESDASKRLVVEYKWEPKEKGKGNKQRTNHKQSLTTTMNQENQGAQPEALDLS